MVVSKEVINPSTVLSDLLITCGGRVMIINWIEGLDRVFAGIQRTLSSIKTAKGNQRYYEYRRTALPYLLWFQENLPYSKLEALYTDTQDLLELMDLATIPDQEYQFIKNN